MAAAAPTLNDYHAILAGAITQKKANERTMAREKTKQIKNQVKTEYKIKLMTIKTIANDELAVPM